MRQMVAMILNNPAHCMMLMEAWEAAGASRITALESTGLMRLRQSSARDNLPLIPSLFDLMRSHETSHRTIFSIVDDETQAQALVDATRQVFAQMEQMDINNSGVLFVLPVTEVHRFMTAGTNQETT